ncbi:hypothetical protein PRIPAC_75704 [Pristionchus pacificus]|uniref:Probable RNA-binding protein EIF1AD n=1 Tax=Pristionchus pacificus TaxID=54126 RepID=A0A2A6CRW8_PRIPA|nr:hypothetical protein PRIPAC_75704 [Pristionchus pacificus]|eukprot:PDM80836.1 hypothetical protein PRIPAC_35839 [Pristionchus pacificus]
MSVASKRRYMMNKLDYEMYLPVEGDSIAQVVGARGNNLHEVLEESGETYLVSMPSKFRKSVWIRKGQFVVVRPIEEGDKVRAEIEHVLDAENVLYIREQNKWPQRFEAEAKLLTREMKRGGEDKEETVEDKDKKVTKSIIDDDMLPPSGSDEDSDEDHEGEEENEEEIESDEVGDDSCDDEEEEDEIEVYNPNRAQAPNDKRRNL